MAKQFNITEVNGVPMVGEGIGFERIRRITGYLVGTLDRFNDGKRNEENDRIKHDAADCCSLSRSRTA